MNSDPRTVDCAIVGAGPAGLTAAGYLARFRRSLALFDSGRSRARWIPRSHNCPGFPAGVSGESLLQRMRRQASESGARTIQTTIGRLQHHSEGFELIDDHGSSWVARNVMLATGVSDRVPADIDLSRAIDAAVVRFCAVCDGPEAEARAIAVYGRARDALGHAIYLRTWSREVAVLFDCNESIERDLAARAAEAGVELLGVAAFPKVDTDGAQVMLADGSCRRFEVLYPALGAEIHNVLATQLQATVDAQGALQVDARQQTSVPGLYAIGDVVSALSQIAVAVGHAAVAASAIHNRLPRNLR